MLLIRAMFLSLIIICHISETTTINSIIKMAIFIFFRMEGEIARIEEEAVLIITI
jgi:hypothetical protein